MIRWHHQCNGYQFEQSPERETEIEKEREAGVLQSMGLRLGHNLATELTEAAMDCNSLKNQVLLYNVFKSTSGI